MSVGDILENINNRLERVELRMIQAEDMLRKLKATEKKKGEGK